MLDWDKYCAHSCSQSANLAEKILSRKICVTSFFKTAQGCAGKINRTSLYAEAVARRVS